MSVFDRLMSGEVLFLPRRDWHSVKGGKMYNAARQAGRYIHFHQHEVEGEPGLRVWIDDKPAERQRTGLLFRESRPL